MTDISPLHYGKRENLLYELDENACWAQAAIVSMTFSATCEILLDIPLLTTHPLYKSTSGATATSMPSRLGAISFKDCTSFRTKEPLKIYFEQPTSDGGAITAPDSDPIDYLFQQPHGYLIVTAEWELEIECAAEPQLIWR